MGLVGIHCFLKQWMPDFTLFATLPMEEGFMSIKLGGLATCVFVFLFGVMVYPIIAANKEFIFVHAQQGNWAKSHKDVIINYLTWDAGKWTAKVNIE
jgi:hypothetical protein